MDKLELIEAKAEDAPAFDIIVVLLLLLLVLLLDEELTVEVPRGAN